MILKKKLNFKVSWLSFNFFAQRTEKNLPIENFELFSRPLLKQHQDFQL